MRIVLASALFLVMAHGALAQHVDAALCSALEKLVSERGHTLADAKVEEGVCVLTKAMFNAGKRADAPSAEACRMALIAYGQEFKRRFPERKLQSIRPSACPD